MNGYVQPVSLEERLAHIARAKSELGTEIPWLADSMENDLKHAFGDRNNSEFVISPEGEIVVARAWSDPGVLREDLVRLVGKAETTTQVSDLKRPPRDNEKASAEIASGVVPRVPRPPGAEALVTTTEVSPDSVPYLKLRAEAPASLVREGEGPLHLSFSLDPIHEVHWNNLAPPMKFSIRPSTGAVITPSEGEATPVTDAKADRDPRDFLLQVNRGSGEGPLTIDVTYFACDDNETWCRSLTQTFLVTWKHDRDAGKIRPAGRSGDRSEGTPRKGRMDPVGIFSRMDRNSDGVIEKGEARGPLVERFDRMDSDKDGRISLEELTAGLEERRR